MFALQSFRHLRYFSWRQEAKTSHLDPSRLSLQSQQLQLKCFNQSSARSIRMWERVKPAAFHLPATTIPIAKVALRTITDRKYLNENQEPSAGEPPAVETGTKQSGPTQDHLRRVVEWEAGDMIATYSIVLLLSAILLSPIAGQYMLDQHGSNLYSELDSSDHLLDLVRIIRRDFLDQVSEEPSLERKGGVVDTLVADVLSSKALQDQVVKFVVAIIQSEEVQSACEKLLGNLWGDLVKSPETIAQVISMLKVAIEDEDLRLATKKLLMQIVGDEAVLEELVRLLQKLGHDQEVRQATRTLLTESAHNALNDPEILDHSMEFATDVVGDDVVQRTAGEALRNTLSYAVQPGVSVVLAGVGVGFLLFSIMSLGYAQSTEQDAKVLGQAASGLARSLQPNPRLVDLVRGFVISPWQAASMMLTVVLLPFHYLQRATSCAACCRNEAMPLARGACSALLRVGSNCKVILSSIHVAIGEFLLESLSCSLMALGKTYLSGWGISRMATWVTGSLTRKIYTWAWLSLEAFRQWFAM